MLPTWLKNNGEDASLTVAQAAKNSRVIAEVQRAVDAANALVSRAESIRKFQILGVDLSEATGHLTPKLSIKRAVITEDFASEIEAIYTDSPATASIALP
jgi:long-chain acyl-CoA synthetase